MPAYRLIGRATGFLGIAAAVAACAASPGRPSAQLIRAQSSIEIAVREGAAEYGPAALRRAREKLARAEAASEDGNHELAERLAEQAELDARYAAAHADRVRAERRLGEINESLRLLREETAQ